ncbi:MAG: hypothetical protein GC166_01770 [Alphaproteobacteria bacterium]|nr:hypothetical protein [Alphaproteobacteria bacterium]
MNITRLDGDRFEIRANRDELRAISNSLNEICNGVHIADFEFQARLSVERCELKTLLSQIHFALTAPDESGIRH